MTRNRILAAIVLLIVPILARGLFYYRGTVPPRKIESPKYESYTVPIPPTASVKAEADPALGKDKVVVIDYYHKNMFDPSELEPFTTLLNERGARVEFYDGAQYLNNQLKYASALIVFSPSIGFSAGEISAVNTFVESGGRLIVFTDPTRSLIYSDYFGNIYSFPDVNYTNPLLTSYGLTFENDYLYNLLENEGNFRNVEFTDFADQQIMRGLGMVVFYGAHSVKTDSGLLLTLGTDKVFSSLTDSGGGFASAALSANGQALAVGDFTFLLDPYNQVADNAAFAAHIADFAVSGERTASLATFPYIYKSQQVQIALAGDAQLSAELMSPIANYQIAMKALNITISIAEETPQPGDTLVLGTLTTPEDLERYVKPFQITFDPYASYIEVPGFGKVGKSGIGLILFSPGAAGNTLILLADTTSDLITLISRAAGGDLSSCVVQGNVAVCPVGFGSSFYDGGTPTPYAPPTGTPYAP
jgi:hypothetical protein